MQYPQGENRSPTSFGFHLPIHNLGADAENVSPSLMISARRRFVSKPQLPSAIAFRDTALRIIDRNGTPWITASDLARALGYKRTNAVIQIYQRNASEFEDDMSQLITDPQIEEGGSLKLREGVPQVEGGCLNLRLGLPQVEGGQQRIFSPRGCHLAALLAKTSVAKAFRRFALDVLDPMSAPPAAAISETIDWVDHPRPADTSRCSPQPHMPTIEYFEGHPIRLVVVEDSGDLWFVATDVLKAIGRTQVSRTLDRLACGEDYAMVHTDPLGRRKAQAAFNEHGLRRLAETCTTVKARTFYEWAMAVLGTPVSPKLIPQRMPANYLPAAVLKKRLEKEAAAAKTLLQEVKRCNEREIEATGEHDALQVGSLIMNAATSSQNLYALCVGLADYICRAMDGSNVDVDYWVPLREEITVPLF